MASRSRCRMSRPVLLQAVASVWKPRFRWRLPVGPSFSSSGRLSFLMSPSVIQPPDRREYCPEKDDRVGYHVSPPPDHSLRDLARDAAALQGALNMPILDYGPISYR